MNNTTFFDVVIAYPAETIRIFETMIPLGISSIIAVLQNNGFTVRFVDFNHYRGDFRADLRKWSPKIIGIGGTTSTRVESFKIARLAKRALPDVPTVYGGVHATFTAEDTLRHVPEIDYIIRGEGEYPFREVCNHFVKQHAIDLSKVAGLCYRVDGGIHKSTPARIQNLDALPIPLRELEDIGYRFKMDFCGLEADYLVTSRGCPARCTFCSASAMFPGGFRYRNVDLVRAELEQILRRNPLVRGIKIFDSTFTADRSHVLDFCRMIKPYGLAWECEARADTVDQGLLREMKEAGCYYVDIGLETSHPGLLRSLGKAITIRQVDDTLDWCKTLGIRTKLFMIFGLLDQTYNDCVRDVRFLKERKGRVDQFATTFGLRVYPGTAVEKILRKRGIMNRDFSWAKYKPSLRNWLLLEFGNTNILEQRQLSFPRLLRVALLLFRQRTLLSDEHIRKLITQNVKNLIAGALPIKRKKSGPATDTSA
jgi:anaerobic magnesium-protoporphyrin IX monomethyl ester cyclase